MAMTIQEVKEMLDVLKKCKKSILSGEAASYSVGSRSVTFLSLDEVTPRSATMKICWTCWKGQNVRAACALLSLTICKR